MLDPMPRESKVSRAEKNRRRHQRHSAEGSFFFYQGPWYNRKKIKAGITDWSETGIGVETNGTTISTERPVRFRVVFPTPKRAPSSFEGTIARADIEDGTHRYGVRFNKSLDQYNTPFGKTLWNIAAAVFTVGVIAALAAVKIEHIRWFWYDPLLRLYTLIAAGFVGTRLLLSLIYKEPGDNGFMPSVSVVVAVKNEEAHISETIHHVFRSRYPMDRLELIVIDDGSTDNTWAVLQRLKQEYPTGLKLLKFPTNKGKRHAMAAGARASNGDILIYVDSDSLIDNDAIYKLVQPFVDVTIGAAAGHTKAIVEPKNVISKMEAMRYHVSHQLFKAAESIFGAVTCCPGAFSAYRRQLVLKVLPAWLDQTFLGSPATFGDDRSLTNYILRDYQVIYHAGAICRTFVPNTWMQFFRQQLRWKKSWVRETTVAVRQMYKKHPLAALSYYGGIVVTFLSPIVLLRTAVYSPMILSVTGLPYLEGVFFVYLALCVLYFLQTRKMHFYCGMLFAAVYMCFLCWQTYYAVLTVNRNHWGTR